MISKDLIDRMTNMLGKMPVREDYLEKYFKKLKSEGEIQDYKYLGMSDKIDRFVMEVKFKSDWYRMGIEYEPKTQNNEARFMNIQVVNHNPYEYSDVLSKNI